MIEVIKQAESQMVDRHQHLIEEYKNLRSGRINPAMLDSLQVDCYGAKSGIKSLATVTVQDRQLIITPFDPSTSKDIAKAITSSPMDLNPIVEKSSIRVFVPPLDETLRKQICKQAKQKAEDAKVSIRDVRRKSNDHIKKQKQDSEITEDDVKRLEKSIQELTDSFCKKSDILCTEKEKEIMTV